jgi:hypothetical protein
MSNFVDCKSYHSAKISSQILGESQEVQMGLVVTQYVFFFWYQTHARCRVTSYTSPFHCSIKCIQSPVAKQPKNNSDQQKEWIIDFKTPLNHNAH